MGRRAARARSLPHRTAAIFDPGPWYRAGSASRLRALWNGNDGLEPAVEGFADRPLPQGTGLARQPASKIFPQADVRRTQPRWRRATHPAGSGSGALAHAYVD